MPAAEVALNFVPPLPGKTAASSLVGLLGDPQQVQDAIQASLARIETPPPPATPLGRRLLDWVPSSIEELVEGQDSPPKPDLAEVISAAEAGSPPPELSSPPPQQSPPVHYQSPPVQQVSPPPPPMEVLPPLQAAPPKASVLPPKSSMLPEQPQVCCCFCIHGGLMQLLRGIWHCLLMRRSYRHTCMLPWRQILLLQFPHACTVVCVADAGVWLHAGAEA